MIDKIGYYFELASRWYVCLMLNVYGWGKLLGGQFYKRGHLPKAIAAKPIGEVGSFDLAWAFMGYSYTYIFIIGAMQVIGALLLLWNRTKLIGAAILVPILFNIIVFDAIFFEGFYGALISACVYFSLLMYVFYYNRLKLKTAIKIIVSQDRANRQQKLFKKVVITLIAIALIIGIEYIIKKMFHA